MTQVDLRGWQPEIMRKRKAKIVERSDSYSPLPMNIHKYVDLENMPIELYFTNVKYCDL